mgnify:CR=1 FL=1
MEINKSIFMLIAIAFLSQFKLYSQVYDSSDLYFEEAKKDISEENFSRAAKMSWRGLQLAPNDLDLKTLLGKANMELGKYDTARYVLRQVYLNRGRPDSDILRYLVIIEQTTKHYSDAICYVNELLEITPYSRSWWLKKILIYKEMGNFEEAERALKRLHVIYPDDTEIQNDYNYIMLNDGNSAVTNKNYDEANEIYNTVIDNDPTNKPAYIGVIRNELLKGNPEFALQYTNRALLELKYDEELITKKIGLLEELGRHEEAIAYIKNGRDVPKDMFPEIHAKTLPYLMQQSAAFNEYNDPYEINKKLYELNGNSESQNYVINKAMGKGYDGDAEYLIKKGIKKNPNNKKLQIQLMELYRPIKDKELFEKEVIKLHEKFPNDTDITYNYNLIMYNRAKTYVENRQFDLALKIYQDLVSSPDFTKESEQQIFGIYLELGQFDEATEQVDKLIGLEPDNPDHLLRKSSLYAKMDLYEDALDITRGLEQNYPLSQKYPRIYVGQTEDYSRFLMKLQRYEKALEVIEDGLTRENNNKDLLNLAINASSAIPDYPKGINYNKSALSFYPNNKNFKIKLSGLLAQNKQYNEAIAVLDSLENVYKYDRKIKNSLAEVLFYRGRNNESEGLINEALVDYNVSDSLNPAEKNSLNRMINVYITQKSNDEALEFINKKIKKYPNNNLLKFKKGVVYELMKQYDSAYYYQQFREIDDLFERQKWSLALEKLRAEKLKNQLAATYTQANSDSTAFSTSLASISYNHRYDKKNTFGADVNYAARRSGVGMQAGVNYSRIFNPTLYADAGVLLGSQFFPRFIFYGNAYKGLKNGFDVQAGIRFTNVITTRIVQENNRTESIQASVSIIALNAGVSKTWEDIWLGGKLSLIRDDQFNYFNAVTQSRINVNSKGDYVSFIFAFGSAPFNEQLPEEATAFLDFSNILVGAGYGYNISPKTKLLANGSWTNFKSPITDSNSIFFINQYNLSVSIITKF